MSALIEIDGAMGEGGGQILRSALSLSLLTGRPFRLYRIRAGRDRPGLRPQHLAALQAAARISGAQLEGDRTGSSEIRFTPGPVRPGEYFFDIGTAGATALVLQTLLLPLALASTASTLVIRGGTHVPRSPCFHYLEWHWRPFLARMGIPFALSMPMAGFYPEGGGELQARIPGHARPTGLQLGERGALRGIRGLSAVANLPLEIAERQRRRAQRGLETLLRNVPIELAVEAFPAVSHGTLLLLLTEFTRGAACFFALGARGKRAEQVADEAVAALARFLATDGAVDGWLADQLLLPLALADRTSELRTSEVTRHLLTNIEVVRRFLPVDIRVAAALGRPATLVATPAARPAAHHLGVTP
jgi:RNA 3'-terminal phosphate cyclase (ATP)